MQHWSIIFFFDFRAYYHYHALLLTQLARLPGSIYGSIHPCECVGEDADGEDDEIGKEVTTACVGYAVTFSVGTITPTGFHALAD